MLAELATGLVAFVALGGVHCLLLDVAHNHALHLRTCLAILVHQPGALVAQLATDIRHRVSPVEFAGMGCCMHHEVLLRLGRAISACTTAHALSEA